MFRRRRRRDSGRIDQGPVVFDADGMPIGVFVPLRANGEEVTPHGRYHVRLAALRKTHELDKQFQLRSQYCMFCSPPPS